MLRAYKARVAVVTGAARGLGRALAEELAVRECNLALVDVDSPALTKTAQDLNRAGVRITHHYADVASEEAIGRVVAEVLAAHGEAHLLINNAAVSASASFAHTSAEVFERIIRVNFLGVVLGCRAFLPLLQRQAEGQILNVASCFAWMGYPGKTAYSSSKGAVRVFSESLRLELADCGIGVTVLYPGPLSTSLVRDGYSDSEERRTREDQFLVRRGKRMERVVKRCLDELLGNPDRIVTSIDYRLMDALVRLSPRLASRAMGFVAARTEF
jgi:NAD(P)-dependent dehydrogenase (short-subunit alcohol dehydrogenase family)